MNSSEQLKGIHAIVHGRVQAVGFRYFTWQTASSLHVGGWVRNLADGTVEIKAEGPEHAVKSFIAAIKKGSPFSKVTHLDLTDTQLIEHFASFEIRNSL